jgi:hypothetical protein
MKTLSLLLAATCCVLFLLGCGKANNTSTAPAQNQPAQPPEIPDVQHAKDAMKAAHDIVANPSQWKENAGLVPELLNNIQDLHLETTGEWLNFSKSANDLIKFGTRWVAKLQEQDVVELSRSLSKLTEDTEAGLRAHVSVAGQPSATMAADFDKNSTSAKVKYAAAGAMLKYRSMEGLQAADADEFGMLRREPCSSIGVWRAYKPLMQMSSARYTRLLK